MEKLLGTVAAISHTKIRSDDDLVDRLNHRYTTFILIVFAIVVSTKQYVGEPINCWCPAHFTDNHEDYTNKVCWVASTYYVPLTRKQLPEKQEPKQVISYYQWVPLLLLCQAMMFYLPCMIWRFLNNKAGVDLNNLIEVALALQHTAYAETREKTIRYVTKNLDRYFGATREYRRGCFTNCKHFLSRNCCLLCGSRYGNYLVFLYLAVKLLYIGNSVGQVFMLNAFLTTDYHVYGFQILHKLILNEDWTASERFPRVTLCDFEMRELGSIHSHTVQCVLPINLFNEKIFIFLWFWLVLISLANMSSFLIWMARSSFRLDRIRYVKRHLRAMDKMNKTDDKPISARFVMAYLRQDGVFILRILGMNANDLVVSEILAELYNNYRTNRIVTINKAQNRRDEVPV